MSVPLPEIRLADIGKQKNGATPGRVTQKLIDAPGKTVNTTVANVDPIAV